MDKTEVLKYRRTSDRYSQGDSLYSQEDEQGNLKEGKGYTKDIVEDIQSRIDELARSEPTKITITIQVENEEDYAGQNVSTGILREDI